LAIAGCAPTLVPPAPTGDLILPTIVPNGRVEVQVRRSYPLGRPVRATVRLLPTTGALRGPLDPFVQASGFHGTATVRRLEVVPASAIPGAPAAAEVVWDAKDAAGVAVADDDYSLVFTVEDDQGRRTTVGATLVLRPGT
jgi:hypothetical protein